MSFDGIFNADVPCAVSVFDIVASFAVIIIFFLRVWRLWFVVSEQREKGRSPTETGLDTGLWFYNHRRYVQYIGRPGDR